MRQCADPLHLSPTQCTPADQSCVIPWSRSSGIMHRTPPPPRDALDGEAPQKRPQRWLDRRLEEVAKAVEGGYCRLQIQLNPALAVKEPVAGHRLGTREGGGVPPPFQCVPAPPLAPTPQALRALSGGLCRHMGGHTPFRTAEEEG